LPGRQPENAPLEEHTAPTAWRASVIAPKSPSSTAKRAGESPSITLKGWKCSRIYEAERTPAALHRPELLLKVEKS